MSMAESDAASAESAIPAALPDPDTDLAAPRGCPFLLAEGGGWRLDVPSRDHRCGAVSPAAALSPEKQARLCLTPGHAGCATYLASIDARGARLGLPVAARTTRWALARTTTVIEDAGGLRARIASALLDRRRWPAIPAVILLVTLFTLAVSGLNSGAGDSPVAVASPSRPAATPQGTVRPSPLPSLAPTAEVTPSAPPSAVPSPTTPASAGPTESFRTYRVQSGDTLSGIASKFGTTARAIAALNGFPVSKTLHAGDILKIPN